MNQNTMIIKIKQGITVNHYIPNCQYFDSPHDGPQDWSKRTVVNFEIDFPLSTIRYGL